MQMSGFAWIMVAATLSAGPCSAEPAVFKLAQVDFGARMGPPRSPNVVIEEPRPPHAVIETEGRGEPRKCRSVDITEWRDGIQVTRSEHECDEH